MADSKDKNLEENDVGLGADSVSPAADSELSAEELAAIERWQLMAGGDDFVLEPQVPVGKKSGKKVKGASVGGSLSADGQQVSPSAVDDEGVSLSVDNRHVSPSGDDELVSPSARKSRATEDVFEDKTASVARRAGATSDAGAESASSRDTSNEEVDSREASSSDTNTEEATASEPNNREAKTKKSKNRKTTAKRNPQEQKADNGIGDQFTEDSEEKEKEKEQDELEEPGEEKLQLIPHAGKDLTLSQENQDDRQGLMRWDEAITLEAQVECIIFATPKPISVSEIAELLADDDGIEPSHASIETHAQQLQRLYKERNGGFRLEYDKGAGYQFRTVPAAAPLMERMFSSRQRPLSRAAHETLAIIAYRQPCTRADIEFIRGVDAGSIIKNLLERDLVTCVGRKEDSGRPMLFGTTTEFLRVFRVQSLNDLPPLSAFQPASEAMINAFQKIENPEDTIDVEEFIGDEDRDPTLVTQHKLAEFAASESGIDVREDALETASQPAQIRRAGGSYDNEGFSRDDGIEDTEVAVGSGNSVAPGSGEDASRGPDLDQRPSDEGTRDED